MNWNNFQGRADRLDDFDIPRIGATIGVGEDEVHAFMDVEASGSGFDTQARPKMLFEPHVFYRNLKGDERSEAVAKGLAYQRWRRNYPKDSYPRLFEAMKINETAALKSASWGLGQILGENYKLAGYDSPQAMVLDFMDDEATHLQAMINFIRNTGIDDDLRAHRWGVVAGVYNGVAYRENRYDTRLAASFARWQKIEDTHWTALPDEITHPDDDIVGPSGYPAIRLGDGYLRNVKLRPYVIEAQKALKEAGFYEGEIDGKFGPRMQFAVKAFQDKAGATVDGVIGGKQTWPLLLTRATPAAEEPIKVLAVGDEPPAPPAQPMKGVGY